MEFGALWPYQIYNNNNINNILFITSMRQSVENQSAVYIIPTNHACRIVTHARTWGQLVWNPALYSASNPVPWQNWMVTYLGYTLRMKTVSWLISYGSWHAYEKKKIARLSFVNTTTGQANGMNWPVVCPIIPSLFSMTLVRYSHRNGPIFWINIASVFLPSGIHTIVDLPLMINISLNGCNFLKIT